MTQDPSQWGSNPILARLSGLPGRQHLHLDPTFFDKSNFLPKRTEDAANFSSPQLLGLDTPDLRPVSPIQNDHHKKVIRQVFCTAVLTTTQTHRIIETYTFFTEVKVKFTLLTNKLTSNLAQVPVPLLGNHCLAF